MVKKLNRRHLELAQLLLRGMKQRDVAKQLNLAEWHVSRVVNSPVYREHMNKLQDQADNELFERRRQDMWNAANRTLDAFHDPNSTHQ
jgi:DNA-binding NarL/FixJ family response regulator